MSRGVTIVIICIILLISIGTGLAGCRHKEVAQDQKDVSPMAGLRLMALNAQLEAIRKEIPPTEHGVWGSVTDISREHGSATVVFLADGTASLYFSTGGGILGGESHESVRRAGANLLQCLERSFASFRTGAPGSLPTAGNVRFYVKARDGLFVSDEVSVDELASGHHALSACFVDVNKVVLALREIAHAPGG